MSEVDGVPPEGGKLLDMMAHSKRQAAVAAEFDRDAIHCTEYGNALRLVKKHGRDIRYCHDWAMWLVWDETRWVPDKTGAIIRRAKDVVVDLQLEILNADNIDQRKEITAHALRSETISRINAMTALASSEPGIYITPAELDSNPMELTVANGVLDLTSGTLRPAAREDYSTKMAPVLYDPTAEAPTWWKFLERITKERKSLEQFLQRAAGYAMTGDTSERALFLLYGTGANGKSVLVETLQTILGDYALRTPTETLMQKREPGIPNDVARLKGARFVTASESDKNKRLAEGFVKELTGGDTISARFMRGEYFDFKPECKIWFRTNHRPTINGTDDGIWDRLKLIPFDVRIPPEEQDRDLSAKLLAESSGILNWMLDGCLCWQQTGLGVPDEVIQATSRYRDESDSLSIFLADCCVMREGVSIPVGHLYRRYSDWCRDGGEHALSNKKLTQDLLDKGMIQFRTRVDNKTTRMWKGVDLMPG